MAMASATTQLEDFATSYRGPDFEIRRAIAALDERLDGEAVTRVALLLNDPSGDTWDVDGLRDLRQALRRRATELGLPSVSLTLVPDSEAETVAGFER